MTPIRSAGILLPTLLLSLLLISCDRTEAPAPIAETRPEATGYNVVFILADTLRADHLGAWGYERPTSPFLDRFAAENLQFRQARSQAACTFPSTNSLLTSRAPFEFLQEETRPGIPPQIPSIAEILQRHGYSTGAVSSSPIVRATPGKHNPVGGYGRGFDVFNEQCEWYPSDCVTQVSTQLIDEELEEPFFLYAHYLDPHDPFIARKEHRGRFASEYTGPHEFIAKGDPNPIAEMIRAGTADELLSEEDLQHLVDLYDEDIYSLDVGLEALYANLEERGILDRTIIILTSDHGEEFLEHGYIKHCYTVYGTETHIPMLMSLPGKDPAAFDAAVQNLDLVPTLLDYLGLPSEPTMEGRSLRPLIEGEPFENLAFSTMGVYRGVDDARHRVIYDLSGKSGIEGWSLYDLEADPGETENQLKENAREKAIIFRELREQLLRWTEKEEVEGLEERLDRAKEIENELRELGYLG